MQRQLESVAPTTYSQAAPSGSKAVVANGSQSSPSCGNSDLEHVLRQLPIEARIRLVDALSAGCDKQARCTLAAARLACKALHRAVDDGLQRLRLNVLPDTDQGPAPCLAGFPNLKSLTLSIGARWRGLAPNYSWHPEWEQPQVRFLSNTYAYPPSLLLEPLLGQPLESLHRLHSLALIGHLTSFSALCEQLSAVFSTEGRDDAGAGPGTHPATSSHGQHDAAASAAASRPHNTPERPTVNDGTSEGTSGGFRAHGSTNACASGSNAGPSRMDLPSADCCNTASCAGSSAACSALPLPQHYHYHHLHVHLGNACFPRVTSTPQDAARGHAALGVLGLGELTLAVELLPGIEAHQVGVLTVNWGGALPGGNGPGCARAGGANAVRGVAAGAAWVVMLLRGKQKRSPERGLGHQMAVACTSGGPVCGHERGSWHAGMHHAPPLPWVRMQREEPV